MSQTAPLSVATISVLSRHILVRLINRLNMKDVMEEDLDDFITAIEAEVKATGKGHHLLRESTDAVSEFKKLLKDYQNPLPPA